MERKVPKRRKREEKVTRGYEVFEGKLTRCLRCRKEIKAGENSYVVRKISDGEVVARFCSKEEEKEYWFETHKA